MTWGFVTCGPNEALVISGRLLLIIGVLDIIVVIECLLYVIFLYFYFRMLLFETSLSTRRKSFCLAFNTESTTVVYEIIETNYLERPSNCYWPIMYQFMKNARLANLLYNIIYYL